MLKPTRVGKAVNLKYLLTFLLLTLFAGLAQGLTVATYNSPESWKAKADVVCTVKNATEVLQAAADTAREKRDRLQLAPGAYRINKTLTVTHCEIRGIGAARLQWTGPETDGFMLHHTGKPGQLRAPHLSGLLFDGNNKIGGLLVDDVHNATISNLNFYRTRGLSFKITKGWVLCVRNVSARYCKGRAFDFSGFSAGTVDMLSMIHIKGNGHTVRITGCADVRQLGIQNCDAGKNPVVSLKSFWSGSLSGYITENNKGTAHLQVEDTIGARIDRLSHWQKPDNPMPDGVVLKRCKDIQFGSMKAWNISGAMLRIGPDCQNIVYDRRLIREGYGQDAGVQPKHIIDHAGRGAKGD